MSIKTFVKGGELDTLKYYHSRGLLNTRETDHRNYTLAHLAAENDQHECLEYLLNLDKNLLRRATEGGILPVHLAAGANNHKCLKIIAEKFPSALRALSDTGRGCGHFATLKRRNHNLRQLAELSINTLSIQDNLGFTPAHIAGRRGDVSCFEVLMELAPQTLTVTDMFDKTAIDYLQKSHRWGYLKPRLKAKGLFNITE